MSLYPSNEAFLATTGGGGSSSFTDLTDTPASYSGEGNKFPVVKPTEDGLQFVAGTSAPTNLSVGSVTDSSFEIANDNGTNVIIPEAVSGGNAGVFSGADKEKIDNIPVGGVGAFPVEIFTGADKNLVVADNLKLHALFGGVMTVTIPENASEAFPIGAEMEFIKEGTGAITFGVSGGAVLRSRDGLVTINAKYSAVTLKQIFINEWRLIGDLA